MTTDPSSDVLERWKQLEDAFHDALPNQGEPGDPAAGKALCQFMYDNSETIRATIERLSAERMQLREALDVARKQIVEITCDATQLLRDLGYECDPPERTYTPALNRIDAALSNTADTRA